MVYYFYVLYSLKDGKLYKGITGDVGKRYLKHCTGGNTSTRNRRPLVLIYVQSFESQSEALKYERYSKTLEGGTALRQELTKVNLLDEQGGLKCTNKDS